MGSHPHVVEDIWGFLQLFSDGSIFRRRENINFSIEVQDDGAVVWTDLPYDEEHGLCLRIYKPRSPPPASLPVILFFRGGGFCLGDRTWPDAHKSCLQLASGLGAVVVSPDYRLAPENRLPAAVEDARRSVVWLREQAVGADGGWLRPGEVDFGRVFVVGDSSGGNLAHQLAVELRRGSPGMEPMSVRGYVLMAPFFGGTTRTKFWRLSLPIGSNADHPWANPFGPSSPNLESVELDPILVLVGGCEVMKDRVEDYYKRLKAMGKEIEYVEYEGQEHGFLYIQPFSEMANKVIQDINRFIQKNSI
ncbi:alpha/beta-Hydrolases superfamily protein [Striga asiatica]|uniref:Alpha/beta-Hydrolases superfamily protein n=1 Tax=Striga asiatica TaxID=4170 RepID=A0A5A7QA40_STRAF|nr:alpha/beta-Hydrolases superfamily protein [Striga asiatica]